MEINKLSPLYILKLVYTLKRKGLSFFLFYSGRGNVNA